MLLAQLKGPYRGYGGAPRGCCCCRNLPKGPPKAVAKSVHLIGGEGMEILQRGLCGVAAAAAAVVAAAVVIVYLLLQVLLYLFLESPNKSFPLLLQQIHCCCP